MEWVEKTRAWRAAMDVIDRLPAGSPRAVSDSDARWLNSYVADIQPRVSGELVEMGFPHVEPRVWVAASYQEFVHMRLAAFDRHSLDNEGATERGEGLAGYALNTQGIYYADTDEVILNARVLLNSAGRQERLQALVLDTLGHETGHKAMRAAVPWLQSHREELHRLSTSETAQDRAPYPNVPYIDPRAYRSRDFAKRAYSALDIKEEGVAEALGWAVLDRQAGHGFVDVSVAREVLRQRAQELTRYPELEGSLNGIELAARVAFHGKEALSAFLATPLDPEVVHNRNRWSSGIAELVARVVPDPPKPRAAAAISNRTVIRPSKARQMLGQ